MKRLANTDMELTRNLFITAEAMLNTLRDHVATLIVVLRHLKVKIPNGYESAVITRLENHKKILDTLISGKERIYESPTTPFSLVQATEQLVVECVFIMLIANTAAEEDEELTKCNEALVKYNKRPTLGTYALNRKYINKGRQIAPEVKRWIETTETAKKTLQETHETLTFLMENIADENLYNTELVPRELVPEA